MDIRKAFDFSGQVAVITGGGVLCSTIAKEFAKCGGTVAIVDLNLDAAKAVANDIKSVGGKAEAFEANVLKKDSLCTIELFREEYWHWEPQKLAKKAYATAKKTLEPHFTIE